MLRRILTSIDLDENVTEYQIRLIKNHYSKIYDYEALISCKNFPVEREKNWLKSVHKQGNSALVVKTDI